MLPYCAEHTFLAIAEQICALFKAVVVLLACCSAENNDRSLAEVGDLLSKSVVNGHFLL